MLYFVMKPVKSEYQTHYIRHGRPMKSKKRAIATAKKLGKDAHVTNSANHVIYVEGVDEKYNQFLN